MDNLPPGQYSLLFIYGDAKIKRENIDVGLGKETVVNSRINTQATGEVITIKEKAPTIDAGSTKQGTTVQQDYMKNVPNRGRTWAGVLGAAAGSQGDALGTSFSGSTSIENNYIVDGVNTTGVALGAGFPTQGSQVINNFIQEIEVITGGYNAEFGRSTGGVVNVVTKTGSNEFHGSVFGNVTAFNAATEDVVTQGSALQAIVDQPTAIDFGFELGGPIIKDKLWFYVGFVPFLTRQTISRKVSTRVDRNQRFFDYSNPNCPKNMDGTCNGDMAADPNGLTTSKGNCELTGTCESDGVADIDPATNTALFEEIERHSFKDKDNTYQFTGKINFAVTPEHQGQVSVTGQANTAHNVFSVLGTPTATIEDEVGLNTDVAAKWTSKFFDNKTQIDLIAGWHRNKFTADPITDTLPNDPTRRVVDTPGIAMRNRAAFPQFGNLGAFGRNQDTPESSEVLKFCTDSDPSIPDPFPRIVNCPIGATAGSYVFNSPIFLGDQVEQRFSGKLTATQRLKAAGHHQFKGGIDFESNVLDNVRGYTGGARARWTSAGTIPLWDITRYVRLDANGADTCGYNEDGSGIPCTYLTRLNVHGNTLNYGAFLQDSWSILPNLTVNAGLRYEQQYLRYAKEIRGKMDPVTGDQYGDNALSLNDLVAPRIGAIYDWTKEGRSKIYASWGRFYESIPMDINDRSFGGEVTVDEFWNAAADCGSITGTGSDTTTSRLPSLPENCPKLQSTGGDPTVLGVAPTGGTSLVVPNTHPQYLDELTVGVEYEVLEDLRVGLSYQNRRMGRVIEDMSTDGANTYFIGNPGEFDEGAEQDMLSQINAMPAGDARDALITRLDNFRLIRTFDKPRRDYNAVQLTASKRFSRAFMVQGSYTFSRLRGNYPGLFSPYRVQVDPNITSQYDLFEFNANRMGPLPFDRPHAFKLDGYYTFDLQKAGRVTAGARLRAQSGIPITAFGAHPIYSVNESFLLPPGSVGRTKFATGADVHVAYGRKIGSMDLELYFELFNVINNQYETGVDITYTTDFTDPIVGGTEADLPYLKTTGQTANVNASGFARTIGKNPNFGNTNARVAPLSGRFGLTLSF